MAVNRQLFSVVPKSEDFELEPVYDFEIKRARERAIYRVFCKKVARLKTPSIIVHRQSKEVLYRNIKARLVYFDIDDSKWLMQSIPQFPELVLFQLLY